MLNENFFKFLSGVLGELDLGCELGLGRVDFGLLELGTLPVD